MSGGDVTPVRQQYLELKRKHPDAILFFRLGDFYETFDTDAELVSRELDIVLTSRPIGKGLRAPLAGIPYHAAENYIARLIDKGYHIAICEQMGDQPAKGIFPRQVVRVVTPGTLVEPGLLPGDVNNYLVALVIDSEVTPEGITRRRCGLSFADITTGEFSATELFYADGAPLRAEIARLRPAEIIFPDSLAISPSDLPLRENAGSGGWHTTPLPAWRFESGRSIETLLAHFAVSTLQGFGLENLPLAARAAGGIIAYLKETEPQSLGLLTSLRVYSTSEFMTLDSATRRNLELTETLRGGVKNSLLGILDLTMTPLGKRLIFQWISQPLLSLDRISTRQDAVEYFFGNSMLRAELRAALKPLGDLERLENRVISGHAQPRDLVAMRDTLAHLPSISRALVQDQTKASILPQIDLLATELSLLQSAIDDDPPATLANTGIIRPGYSVELDGVIEASRGAREWINNLEPAERERTGIRSLKVGYNKVFGYYIEISHANSAAVPSDYIRKQTLVNAERYITPEMKEYETLVLNAEQRIHELELRLFKELCAELSKSSSRILATARALAELDTLSALAEVAALNNYIRPQLIDSNGLASPHSDPPILDIRNGRHPVVEQTIGASSPMRRIERRKEPSAHGPGEVTEPSAKQIVAPQDRFVPNDLTFEPGEIVRILTGPNMAGKSTYIRQAALIILMAQIGSFVPAERATISLVDRIFTRIGAQDELHAGQSTFMVEMIEAANILHHATPRSLLILDEVGRGTSTYDGLSIAWAVVEYIHNHPQLRARTLFATHYHELTQLADLLPGIRNYNVAVAESEAGVVFLHRIIPGGADRSYGIHVAQLAGLPRPVIQRANEIMAELEKSSGRAVRINPHAAQQIALFPETSPLLDELAELDVNSLSPIEALNKLFEWQKRYTGR